jgi:hypothetical protein
MQRDRFFMSLPRLLQGDSDASQMMNVPFFASLIANTRSRSRSQAAVTTQGGSVV